MVVNQQQSKFIMLNIFLPAGNMQKSTKIVIFLLSIIFWYFERLWYVESHRLNFLNHKIIIFWPLGIRNRSQNGGPTILAYEGHSAHSDPGSHWTQVYAQSLCPDAPGGWISHLFSQISPKTRTFTLLLTKKPVLKIFFTEEYVKFGHFFTKDNFFFGHHF